MSTKNEILKSTGEGIAKSLISIVPWAGTALNEALFDIRGRIKQERFNKLTTELSTIITKLDKNKLDIDKIKSEDFIDIFESIIASVLKTKSENKIKIFAQIISDQIISDSNNFEKAELFVTIISDLKEQELEILKELRRIVDSKNLNKEAEDVFIELNPITYQEKYTEVYPINYRLDKVFGFSIPDFRILLESLIAKSLVYDDPSGFDTKARSKIGLTYLGNDLVEYIAVLGEKYKSDKL